MHHFKFHYTPRIFPVGPTFSQQIEHGTLQPNLSYDTSEVVRWYPFRVCIIYYVASLCFMYVGFLIFFFSPCSVDRVTPAKIGERKVAGQKLLYMSDDE